MLVLMTEQNKTI